MAVQRTPRHKTHMEISSVVSTTSLRRFQSSFRAVIGFNNLQLDQKFPNGGCLSQRGIVGSLGARIVYMRDIFILNEMLVQGKVHILVGNFLLS